MNRDTKLIRVFNVTHVELIRLKIVPSETFDSVIHRLINEFKLRRSVFVDEKTNSKKKN